MHACVFPGKRHLDSGNPAASGHSAEWGKRGARTAWGAWKQEGPLEGQGPQEVGSAALCRGLGKELASRLGELGNG